MMTKPDKHTFSRTFRTLRLTGAFAKPITERELMQKAMLKKCFKEFKKNLVQTRRISVVNGQTRPAVQDSERKQTRNYLVQKLHHTDFPQRVLCEWRSNHLSS